MTVKVHHTACIVEAVGQGFGHLGLGLILVVRLLILHSRTASLLQHLVALRHDAVHFVGIHCILVHAVGLNMLLATAHVGAIHLATRVTVAE